MKVNMRGHQLIAALKTDLGLRRLARNAGVLLSGNIVGSLLLLGAFALTARGLGPEQFGVLVLISAVVLIVDRLVSFQSWQAIIRFGAKALNDEGPAGLARLVKFGLILDAGGSVLGAIVAVLVGALHARWQGWGAAETQLAVLYGVGLLVNFAGTPTGVLRLFDRFRLLAVQSTANGAIRLVGTLIVYALDGGLFGYAAVWIASDVASRLLLFGLALRELARRDIRFLRTSVRGVRQSHPGLLGFVFTTNMDSTVRVGRELDVVIIGGLLSVEAVGLYKVAKQIAVTLGRYMDPIFQAIFPDLAKLWSAGEIRQFRQLVWRTSLVMGSGTALVWGAFALFGDDAIGIVFGTEYLPAYGPALWTTMAMVIWGFGLPLSPALLAQGRAHVNFAVHAACTAIYLMLLFALPAFLGLIGTGVTLTVFYGLWTFAMMMIFFSDRQKSEGMGKIST